MNRTQQRWYAALTCGFSIMFAACGRTDGPHTESDGHEHATDTTAEQLDLPSNRVDIPAAVRQSLGITFVKVEPRRVEQTLRVPGRFEYLSSAHREYRTALPGRVEILVDQYEPITAGTPLFRIDSPAWRDLQQQISESESAIERSQTRLASFGPLRAAHQNHEQLLAQMIEVRRERVTQLQGVVAAGGGRVAELSEALAAITTAEADLAEVLEKEAELEADEAQTRSELKGAGIRRELLLATAAAFLGRSIEELTASPSEDSGASPLWRTTQTVDVLADAPGIVESLGVTNGAWADEQSVVAMVVRPQRLRFRAAGLQSDLGRLRNGLGARIVAPTTTRSSGSIDLGESMEGELRIGLNASSDQRTIDLLVTPTELTDWARAGVSAQLEVVTDGTASPALSVPIAAVQRDGLVPVLFRRDPADPNKAIRIEADLGLSDGRWIVVNSGLRLGDEVVLDGAFQLMLASAQAGGQQQGGHFHADGTFHAGEDE